MELNNEVLKLIKSYPTDGTHQYYWPKIGSYDGVTKDLLYKDSYIAKANALHQTYCCGLTFEIWFQVVINAGMDLVSAKNVMRIKADWFVATGKRGGPTDALVPRHLGQHISDLHMAKPGDFVQLWRKSGSGHSVIFMGQTDKTITYWSTQNSTNGIGLNTEKFESPEVKNPVTQVYVTRATTLWTS